jgi:hypothetical protein
MIKRYFVNLLIAIDQLGNTIIGGDPDETISSRAGKNITVRARERRGGWYWLCRALHVLDPNHCKDAIEHDEGSEQLTRR